MNRKIVLYLTLGIFLVAGCTRDKKAVTKEHIRLYATSLTARVTADGIALSWQSVTGAALYELQRIKLVVPDVKLATAHTFVTYANTATWKALASTGVTKFLDRPVTSGWYGYRGRALDAENNESPWSQPVTAQWNPATTAPSVVDTVPPETLLTGTPAATGTANTATFIFGCSETACTYTCNLDDTGWTTCNSPQTYSGLAVGSHSFEVRAADAAGNIDPTPATASWQIQLVIPSGGVSVQSISVGSYHSCAVRTDGTLWCWGVDSSAQLGDEQVQTYVLHPVLAGQDTDWQSVALGGAHSCGIKVDGSLWCWGANYYGQTGADSSTLLREQVGVSTDWKQVSLGTMHTCALNTGGSLWCWGENRFGKLGIGSTVNVSAPVLVGTTGGWAEVAAGDNHTCAIQTNRSLWCWGYNKYGQLGDSATASTGFPVAVSSVGNWLQVTAGKNHNCALSTDHRLWCWGKNSAGQLGIGTTATTLSPTLVTSSTDWSRVVAGGDHTCALKNNGTLWCWGDNEYGMVGNGTDGTAVSAPLEVSGSALWTDVALGVGHTCALDAAGAVRCWGLRILGLLGDDIDLFRAAPVAVTALNNLTDIFLGFDHGCGIGQDGSLWCWGANTSGQLGDGTTLDRQVPVAVSNSTDWLQVSGGSAIRQDQSLWFWGFFGQFKYSLSPVEVSTTSDWRQVASSAGHACMIKTDGTLWCWGKNDNGQLGIGTTSWAVTAPVMISSSTNWKQVVVGSTHSCAIKNDDTLWCWGDNVDGAVGNGTTTTQTRPVLVAGGHSWRTVSAGSLYTCGIATDNSLWCWGSNFYGKLGLGTNAAVFMPTQVGTDTNWQEVSAAWNHTCALTTNGRILCWGTHDSGMIHPVSYYDQPTPTPMDTATDWNAVYAGGDATCASKTDGTMWCWGSDLASQLGDGMAWVKSPQKVIGLP